MAKRAQYLPDDLSDVRANPIMYGLPEEAKNWDDETIVNAMSEFSMASKKTATLKDDLMRELELTEDDFDTHESDLYVRSTPGVQQWLQNNYEHYGNVTSFISQIDQKEWFDIPFGYMDEDAKSKGIASKTASLAERLHEAKYVYHDPETNSVYAWFGSTMVNIYDEDGYEVDVFSFSEPPDNIEQKIKDHIEGEKELDAEYEAEDRVADDSVDASKKKADYQGWKNYETWNVALWFDNDQGSHEMVREWAEEAKAAGTEADEGSYSDATMQLSDQIKNYVEENNPVAGEASMYTDLMQAAIDEVDFRAIAQSILDEE